MRPDELERRLRERLDALGPAPRAELLHVLMLPDFERADRIGEFWSYPESRTFAELLIDCEEDRTLRAVLVGMLREGDRERQLLPRTLPAARQQLGSLLRVDPAVLLGVVSGESDCANDYTTDAIDVVLTHTHSVLDLHAAPRPTLRGGEVLWRGQTTLPARDSSAAWLA